MFPLKRRYTQGRARSSVDRAPDSGSGCRGFKSLRARLLSIDTLFVIVVRLVSS